jgi:hypothetical protein
MEDASGEEMALWERAKAPLMAKKAELVVHTSWSKESISQWPQRQGYSMPWRLSSTKRVF